MGHLNHFKKNIFQQDRILTIDALRGLSMLGIMMVNYPTMNTIAGQESINYGFGTSITDRIVSLLNMNFLNGKFYPIFAYLFGLGMYIFMENAKKKHLNPIKLAYKRITILALIGMAHIFLVWWGDILLCYAWLALFLIPSFFIKVKKLYLIAFLLISTSLFPLLFALLGNLGLWDQNKSISCCITDLTPDDTKTILIYSAGTFKEIFSIRIRDYLLDFFGCFFYKKMEIKEFLSYISYYTSLFGIFILGMASGKSHLHKNIEKKLNVIKNIFKISFLLSLVTFFFNWFLTSRQLGNIKTFNGITTALFYMSLIVLILHRDTTQRLTTLLIPVGKMSLTSYLIHTTLSSLLLYGYGAGLFGKVGPALLTGIGLLCYSFIYIFCVFWLRNFNIGPFELIWRKATYLNKNNT